MSTMHVDFMYVNESHNVKNMWMSSWKNLRQMKNERFSQRFWLMSMLSTLISIDSFNIIDALNIASSSSWNNLNHLLFNLHLLHLKEFIKFIVKEQDNKLNQMIQEARNAVNCFATALLNVLIHHHEESCWFNDRLLELETLILRTVIYQFLTKYAEEYQAQIDKWKSQALTDLLHLQMQWNKDLKLQKKNERFMKMKIIKIIDKVRMLQVCNNLLWLFISYKKVNMHFTNDDVQIACMNQIIDQMLLNCSLIQIYSNLVKKCFKLVMNQKNSTNLKHISKSTLIISSFHEMTLIID